METNDVMNNDEIMETTTEEIAKMSSEKNVNISAGIGLVVLVGVAGIAIYKYVGKPIIAKMKAKKEQKIIDTSFEDLNIDHEKEENFEES